MTNSISNNQRYSDSISPKQLEYPPLSSFKQKISDIGHAGLGLGELATRQAQANLPGLSTSLGQRVAAAVPRALGGIVSLGLAGFEIVSTFKRDFEAGRNDFSDTRNKVASSLGSIAAGAATGVVAGLATAGLTAVGAPALLVGGAAVSGVLAVGFVTSMVKEWIEG